MSINHEILECHDLYMDDYIKSIYSTKSYNNPPTDFYL